MSAARQLIEAQIEEAKRKLREQAEAEALRRMTGGGAALDLPTRIPLAVGAPVLEPPPMELPTRQVSVDVGEPPPSNVLEFPTRKRIVSAPENTQAPLELPNYRPATVEATTGPVEAPPSGLPTRQRLVNPRGTVAYQDKLLTDLQSMPPEKMSRKKAALSNFLRFLSSGNLVTGGVGALVGAIAPGATSKLERREKIAEAAGELDTAVNREGKLSTIQARRAAPAKELEAQKERERDNLRQIYSSQTTFDPENNPEHKQLRDRAAVLGMVLPKRTADEKNPPHVTVTGDDGVERVFERRNGNWVPAQGLPTRKKESVFVPGYGHVTPAQKLQADATASEREYRRTRDTQGDTRHETERTQDKTEQQLKEERARREKAAGIAGEVAAANADAAKWQDLAARTSDKATKNYYESLVLGEKQKGIAKALELSQGYGDLYEAGPGEQGWAYVKPKAPQTQAERLPTRGGGKPGAIQPNEDPAVRAYANAYFRGNYSAALEAIRNQKRR